MNRWPFTFRAKKFLQVLGFAACCIPMAQATQADEDPHAVEVAQQATDSLISAVLAAVLDVTNRTTPETIVPESQVISLLLANSKKAYRLLDGTGDPINKKNKAKGKFEKDALEAAKMGETTQEVIGNKLRTVIPLPYAVANCGICHDYDPEFVEGDIVGAVSLRVRLLRDLNGQRFLLVIEDGAPALYRPARSRVAQ